MRKLLFSILACVLILAVGVLLFEGAYSLYKGRRPHLSLSYRALLTLGVVGASEAGAAAAYAPYFTDPAVLSDLVESLQKAGIGIGNSPWPGPRGSWKNCEG